MACCKVPIKIAGFSGGCARVTEAGSTLKNLTSIDDTTYQVSGSQLSHLAYLGLKCVNIACPPTLVVNDNMASLVAFLDVQLVTTIDTDVTLGALGAANVTASSLIKNGIARLISGCGCCSS